MPAYYAAGGDAAISRLQRHAGTLADTHMPIYLANIFHLLGAIIIFIELSFTPLQIHWPRHYVTPLRYAITLHSYYDTYVLRHYAIRRYAVLHTELIHIFAFITEMIRPSLILSLKSTSLHTRFAFLTGDAICHHACFLRHCIAAFIFHLRQPILMRHYAARLPHVAISPPHTIVHSHLIR